MKVSFANLDGRWALKFTGGTPTPGDEYDVPKRYGRTCHKTVGDVLKVDRDTTWTSYTPDCGRVPKRRDAKA